MGLLSTALQSTANSAKDTLREAVLELQRGRIESASLDARLLLQHILGVTREQLLADNRLSLSFEQEEAYQDLIDKRLRRQPISQLIGKREFWGHSFKVTPATLDPRPDSETLIEAILGVFRDKSAALNILDLGTGTGCLLLTLLSEYENARGTGVDICESALGVAQENAANLGLKPRSQFVQSRWSEKLEGTFDIIISNPPYIPTRTIESLAPEVCRFEPKLALDGGEDGLDCYRAIAAQLPKLLAKDGLAIFELGIGQQRDVETIVTEQGLQVTGVKEDLASIPRCILIRH
jgi:release factor glutamine methyltransferase